jgi:ParB/RepB/Spo0J family partition protein
MTTAAAPTLAANEILVKTGFNARQEIADESLASLILSVKHLGILLPLIVSMHVSEDGKHHLLDGHRRFAAGMAVGVERFPVSYAEVSDTAEDGGTAKSLTYMTVANMVRQQFTPAEEAAAIEKLLNAGYTDQGAAEILGWAPALITRRVALLQLPADARTLWQPPANAPAEALPGMLKIHTQAPWLIDLIVGEATRRGDDKPLPWRLLTKDPSRFIGDVFNWESKAKFPKDALLLSVPSRQQIQAGYSRHDVKWGKPLIDRMSKLIELRHRHKEYSASIEFTQEDIDRARAAGALLELDGKQGDNAAWITSLTVAKTIVGEAIDRDTERLNSAPAAKAKAARAKAKKTEIVAEMSPLDLAAKLDREKGKQWRDQAQQPNLELGRNLLNKLAQVGPNDPDVARFFVYGLLGRRGDPAMNRSYGTSNACTLAAAGMRYVMEDWQSVESVKGGTKVNYMTPDEAEAKLWKWLDQAETAAEIFGRGIIIYAAAKEALEHVVARNSRVMAQYAGFQRASVNNSTADKALETLIAKANVIPADLQKLSSQIRLFDSHKEAMKQIDRAKKDKAASKPAAKKAAQKGRKA